MLKFVMPLLSHYVSNICIIKQYWIEIYVKDYKCIDTTKNNNHDTATGGNLVVYRVL